MLSFLIKFEKIKKDKILIFNYLNIFSAFKKMFFENKYCQKSDKNLNNKTVSAYSKGKI